ncbi:uncharacterized protein MYCFIDRAFT_178274 [Pseudocercospora fijiensis CIRAD86]|uniref:Uncharacterized protein n=1 Tax=Pseudocercospora fijiensis (strain CIRAD86) TaxID=383855 RepID=M3A525_PSEFD|nr:uncharacterized protein MYCFIDRAFT_178274 [Pseudocercospora fijiensis CIRAD86]EME79706.1 hypothetical protein MYCFIDRAFT_178274 [Pseudocercospora fijiensis CIRAD86]
MFGSSIQAGAVLIDTNADSSQALTASLGPAYVPITFSKSLLAFRYKACALSENEDKSRKVTKEIIQVLRHETIHGASSSYIVGTHDHQNEEGASEQTSKWDDLSPKLRASPLSRPGNLPTVVIAKSEQVNMAEKERRPTHCRRIAYNDSHPLERRRQLRDTSLDRLCTEWRSHILLRDGAFICGNDSCINRLPRRGPAHIGDDQEGVDPKNSHCYCGVASRRRKNRHGIEREECAALRCEYQGEEEKQTRKLNIRFPKVDWVAHIRNSAGATRNHMSPELSAETAQFMKRTDSTDSLFPHYGRANGQVTPGTTTPREGLSRRNSMTFSQANLTMTKIEMKMGVIQAQGIDNSVSIAYRSLRCSRVFRKETQAPQRGDREQIRLVPGSACLSAQGEADIPIALAEHRILGKILPGGS